MTTNLQLFSDPRFGEIRVMQNEKGEPWFAATDICNSLGYANPSKAIKDHTDDDERYNARLDRGGNMLFINESGLYSLILRSRMQTAKQFRKWVTSDVLPAIRKNGGYIMVKSADTSDEIIARALIIANETLNRQNELLKESEPKVLFAKAVESSNKSILIGELAKILNQNGIEIGQNRFYTWLRQKGYLGVKGDYYNMPTQRAMELGLFEIKETTINQPGGKVLISRTSKVTGKGQVYFVNKFLCDQVKHR
jgi:anti-repressor protein